MHLQYKEETGRPVFERRQTHPLCQTVVPSSPAQSTVIRQNRCNGLHIVVLTHHVQQTQTSSVHHRHNKLLWNAMLITFAAVTNVRHRNISLFVRSDIDTKPIESKNSTDTRYLQNQQKQTCHYRTFDAIESHFVSKESRTSPSSRQRLPLAYLPNETVFLYF